MIRVLAAAILVLAGCSSAPQRTRPAADADRLSAAGSEAYAAGEYHTAVARFSSAADAARSLDDGDRLARELHNRGLALLAAGSPQAAADDFTASLSLSEAAPALDRATTRLALAQALGALGKTGDALAEADRAIGEAADSHALAARAAAAAASLAVASGDPAGASRRLATARSDGDQASGAALDHARGLIALANQDPAAAEAAFARAAEVCRDLGDQPGLAAALDGAARTSELTGAWAEAAMRWRRAAGIPVGGESRHAACLRAAVAAEAKAGSIHP